MMKPRSRTGEAVVVAGAKPVQAATELPLSVIHAEALYRPVPPVEYHDEGYPGPDGNVPDLVIEVVSRSTWRKDVNVKPPLYEALGIAEFWLFDPLHPRLAGFELVRGRYREIAERPEGGLRSRVLALDLLVMYGELRCRDPRDAKVIPDHVETVRMLDVAERKLSQADHERAEADRQLAEADRELATSKREREQALRRVAELAALLRQARAEC